ncbi:hypothetical protein ACKVWM_011742 [Pyricularia oryzae]
MTGLTVEEAGISTLSTSSKAKSSPAPACSNISLTCSGEKPLCAMVGVASKTSPIPAPSCCCFSCPCPWPP